MLILVSALNRFCKWLEKGFGDVLEKTHPDSAERRGGIFGKASPKPLLNTHILDARRLLCPMPLIRTQNAIKKLSVGEILEVVCTDPGTEYDIPTWCRMYGHKLLTQEQRQTEDEMLEYCFIIEKMEEKANGEPGTLPTNT